MDTDELDSSAEGDTSTSDTTQLELWEEVSKKYSLNLTLCSYLAYVGLTPGDKKLFEVLWQERITSWTWFSGPFVSPNDLSRLGFPYGVAVNLVRKAHAFEHYVERDSYKRFIMSDEVCVGVCPSREPCQPHPRCRCGERLGSILI